MVLNSYIFITKPQAGLKTTQLTVLESIRYTTKCQATKNIMPNSKPRPRVSNKFLPNYTVSDGITPNVHKLKLPIKPVSTVLSKSKTFLRYGLQLT